MIEAYVKHRNGVVYVLRGGPRGEVIWFQSCLRVSIFSNIIL